MFINLQYDFQLSEQYWDALNFTTPESGYKAITYLCY
jgi:hypothetical protein